MKFAKTSMLLASSLIAPAAIACVYFPVFGQESPRLSRPSNVSTSRRIPASFVDNRKSLDGLEFTHCIVVAPETFEISVQETGTIAELTVSENSNVTKGDVVGRMQAETLELEKQVAGLHYQVAQAESLDEGDVRFAEMVVEEARLQQDAYDHMGSKGDASPLEVRQKRIATEQAKVRLTQAKATKAQKELKARLAEASYTVAQKKLQRLHFESPADGLVVRIDHRAGEWVSAGTPVLKMVRMDELRVDFFIDIGETKPSELVDQEVLVSIVEKNSDAPRFQGVITGFAPEVSSTQKVRMNAIITNRKSNGTWVLLPGMAVTLQLTGKLKSQSSLSEKLPTQQVSTGKLINSDAP